MTDSPLRSCWALNARIAQQRSGYRGNCYRHTAGSVSQVCSAAVLAPLSSVQDAATRGYAHLHKNKQRGQITMYTRILLEASVATYGILQAGLTVVQHDIILSLTVSQTSSISGSQCSSTTCCNDDFGETEGTPLCHCWGQSGSNNNKKSPSMR